MHKITGIRAFQPTAGQLPAASCLLPAAARLPPGTSGLSGQSRAESLASLPLPPPSCLHLIFLQEVLFHSTQHIVLRPFSSSSLLLLTRLFVPSSAAGSRARPLITTKLIFSHTVIMGEESLRLLPITASHIWFNHTPARSRVGCKIMFARCFCPSRLWCSAQLATCSVCKNKRMLAGSVEAGWIWGAVSLGSRRN